MAISVADNFSYQGTKPLDARIKFDTVANMKAFVEAKLYDGCLAYVTGTKKYYSFDSTNTVDPDTGKWREYSTGGSYVLPIASDEVLGGIKVGDNLEIGDDGTLNVILPNVDLSNEISGHNAYSTTEKLIGQWTDGKPLYQKTYATLLSSSNKNQYEQLDSNFEVKNMYSEVHNGKSCLPMGFSNTTDGVFFYAACSEGNIVLMRAAAGHWAGNYAYTTIQYTKTTDSAQAIGSPNDYSTTEKIVGTWINGEPIYQIVTTDPSSLVYSGIKIHQEYVQEAQKYIVQYTKS